MIYQRKGVANFVSIIFQSRNLSNKSCILTKPNRTYYLRQYPTLIVQPDGSTFSVRYEEPRGIIKLPLDLSTVSEEKRAQILANRRPKKRVIIQYEEKDDFDYKQYVNILGKK